MRKTTIVTLLLIGLSVTTAYPFMVQRALASHAAYDTRNCVAAGQGPSCLKVFIEGNLDFSFISTWDPGWDYETYAGSLLGGVIYEMPVIYAPGPSGATGLNLLAATSSIKSIDIANGTYYKFTINSGIHARELFANGTIHDYGAITANDWAYSIQRSIAQCNPNGPASVVYPFIYGANDWFSAPDSTGNCFDNATQPSLISSLWTTFMSRNPIKALDSTHFAIKVDADFNVTNGQQPYTAFLGVLANSWGVVYPQSIVDAKCGTLLSQVGGDCAFMDAPKSIGTGPYLYDESNTDPTKIILQKNANYCEGDRSDPAICNSVVFQNGTRVANPVAQANRPDTIIITSVADETTRKNELFTGAVDHSVLAPLSYSTFLNPSTTPSFDALNTNTQNEYMFQIIPTLTIQHQQLLVHRSATAQASFGISPLEGNCPSSPGCLIRQAIRTTFNYNNYMQNIVLGLGTRLSTFMPDGFTSGNTIAQANGVPLATTSALAAEALVLAAGYNSTHKLFNGLYGTSQTIRCAYNLGNDPRSRACISLASSLGNLRSCNPSNPDGYTCGGSHPPADPTCTATIAVTGADTCRIVNADHFNVVAPSSSYIVGHVNKQEYDIAGLGWFPDYVDEDDYARPYAYTGSFGTPGTFMLALGYTNATLDSQIDTAAGLTAGPARTNLYFAIERTLNHDCQCYIWLQQPNGRSIWSGGVNSAGSGGITSAVFSRLVDPAFLPYYLDIQKTAFVPSVSTPVFPSVIGVILLAGSIALSAVLLLRRTSTRKTTLSKYV